MRIPKATLLYFAEEVEKLNFDEVIMKMRIQDLIYHYLFSDSRTSQGAENELKKRGVIK